MLDMSDFLTRLRISRVCRGLIDVDAFRKATIKGWVASSPLTVISPISSGRTSCAEKYILVNIKYLQNF